MGVGYSFLALFVLIWTASCGGRSDLSIGVSSVDACTHLTCSAPPSACYAPVGTCKDGACSYAFADGMACDDGDPCTGSDSCEQGVCKGQAGLCPVAGSASKVSVGQSHACALTKSGEVWCWGYNEFGQLGNHTHVDSPVPVRVLDLSRVSDISVGFGHACAIDQELEVKCWGFNGSGQLGNDSNLDSVAPVSALGLPSAGALVVSAGYDHTCAAARDGRTYCWGSNGVGQLGNDFSSETLAAYEVQGLPRTTALVFAGMEFTCILTRTGGVECFGSGARGQLGQGRHADSKVPVQVVGLDSNIVGVSAGGAHACAVLFGGKVKCWGDNTYGQLGPNVPREGSSVPVDIPGLSARVTAISSGMNQTCVILEGGAVQCWGDGDHGQLGNGSTMQSAVPVAVSGLDSGVVDISAGTLHACAVTGQGGIECWGYNAYGALGNGSRKDSLVPTPVRGF